MGVYLQAKFQVSSIILPSFRQGGGGGGGDVNTPPFTSKQTTQKPTQIKVKALLNIQN